MVRDLPNLKWRPAWVSHLGCIKGCLDYLQIPVSMGWLYGGTGHAFLLNIDATACPSGPTAWHAGRLFQLGNNLGYSIRGICHSKAETDFQRYQQAAWEQTKDAIDRGLPCYGWELDIPEYYVITGYDDEGYYYSGPPHDRIEGPKRWSALGLTEIGMLEAYVVEKGDTADDITVIKEALQFVLEHAQSPAKWINPGYKAGLAGYDNWLKAVNSPDANAMGLAYNAAVWHECRSFAVEFLAEARQRLGGPFAPLLAEAQAYYAVIAEQLEQLNQLYPFPPRNQTSDNAARQGRAVALLTAARSAEESGLRVLQEITETDQ